jgi:hypothetical protein
LTFVNLSKSGDFEFDLDSFHKTNKKSPEGLLKLIAEMFEYLNKVITDHFGISAFDVVTLDEMNQLPVLEKGHSRGGWRIREYKFSHFGYCLAVISSKNGCQCGRLLGSMFYGISYPWSCCTGSTATH